MQIQTSYSGQYFGLTIVKEDGRFTTMILSTTDRTNNHVVPIEPYELKHIADFIYEVIGEKTN